MNNYKYGIYAPNKLHTPVPHFVDTYEEKEGYGSLYLVDEASARAVTDAGTTAGFRGVVWSDVLWMDFDDKRAADQAATKLKEMGYGFVEYTTGGRGAHFGISRSCSPSHLLPARDKSWVQENFPAADTSIYTHLHLFRLPGTKHERTGLEKRLVSQQNGKVLVLPPLKRLVVAASRGEMGTTSSQSVLDNFLVMRYSAPQSVGKRHEALVRLVNALKNDLGCSAAFSRAWVEEVNKRYTEQKTEEELDYLVRSLYESAY